MKKLLERCYKLGKKYIFGGKGLTRFSFIRNINMRFEKFLKGRHVESVRTRGMVFYLDPRDSIRNYEYGGDYEKFSTSIVEKLLREGDTFVDVGASIGWFTIIASKKVGQRGHVYAFEPNPLSAALLKKNMAENRCGNVTMEHMAVTNSPQKISLWVVDDIWTGSTIFDPRKDPKIFMSEGEDKPVKEYEVMATSIDSYLGNKTVNFIKIDTEGSEGRVFEGMKETIKRDRDIVILAEFNPVALRGTGTDPREWLANARQDGFSIFLIDEKREALLPLTTVPDHGTNLLFIRDPRRVA